MRVIVESVAKKCGGRICRITELSERLSVSKSGIETSKSNTDNIPGEIETPMVLIHTRVRNTLRYQLHLKFFFFHREPVFHIYQRRYLT